MYAQSREALPSLNDGRPRTQPSLQLLLSSAQAGWPDLLVQHYRFTTEQPHLYLPAQAADLLLLPLHGEANLRGKVGAPFTWQSVQPGQLFLIPRHIASEWQWTAPWEVLALFLAPTVLATVAAAELGRDAPSVQLMPRSGVVDAFLHQLGLALLTELKNGGIAGQRYVATLTHALALHLLRNHALLQQVPATCPVGLAPQTLRNVLDYIESHLPQPLTQAEVAAIAHVSPFHFARLFKQATGQSLHQYILSRRIAAAQRLLLTDRLTLAEIALQVGFTDQSHLTRHFKRQCGVTPKRFAQERTNVQRGRTIMLESGGGSG